MMRSQREVSTLHRHMLTGTRAEVFRVFLVCSLRILLCQLEEAIRSLLYAAELLPESRAL